MSNRVRACSLSPFQSVVAETPGIKQCFLVEEDGKASGSSKVWQLKIDGVNLHVCMHNVLCVCACVYAFVFRCSS